MSAKAQTRSIGRKALVRPAVRVTTGRRKGAAVVRRLASGLTATAP